MHPLLDFLKNEDKLGCELSFIDVMGCVFPALINVGLYMIVFTHESVAVQLTNTGINKAIRTISTTNVTQTTPSFGSRKTNA